MVLMRNLVPRQAVLAPCCNDEECEGSMYIHCRFLSKGGSLDPVHWTRWNGDMCPFLDTCHNPNGSSVTGY